MSGWCGCTRRAPSSRGGSRRGSSRRRCSPARIGSAPTRRRIRHCRSIDWGKRPHRKRRPSSWWHKRTRRRRRTCHARGRRIRGAAGPPRSGRRVTRSARRQSRARTRTSRRGTCRAPCRRSHGARRGSDPTRSSPRRPTQGRTRSGWAPGSDRARSRTLPGSVAHSSRCRAIRGGTDTGWAGHARRPRTPSTLSAPQLAKGCSQSVRLDERRCGPHSPTDRSSSTRRRSPRPSRACRDASSVAPCSRSHPTARDTCTRPARYSVRVRCIQRGTRGGRTPGRATRRSMRTCAARRTVHSVRTRRHIRGYRTRRRSSRRRTGSGLERGTRRCSSTRGSCARRTWALSSRARPIRCRTCKRRARHTGHGRRSRGSAPPRKPRRRSRRRTGTTAGCRRRPRGPNS